MKVFDQFIQPAVRSVLSRFEPTIHRVLSRLQPAIRSVLSRFQSTQPRIVEQPRKDDQNAGDQSAHQNLLSRGHCHLRASRIPGPYYVQPSFPIAHPGAPSFRQPHRRKDGVSFAPANDRLPVSRPKPPSSFWGSQNPGWPQWQLTSELPVLAL